MTIKQGVQKQPYDVTHQLFIAITVLIKVSFSSAKILTFQRDS